MINFLITHIIRKVRERTRRVCNNENYKGFIWLEDPIKDGKFIINRVDEDSAYAFNHVLPISWYSLKPITILEVYKCLKSNEVYISRRKGGEYIRKKPNELLS